MEPMSGRKAIYDFQPLQTGDLAISVGDEITHISDVGNGWLQGKNETTGNSGYFPAIYTAEIKGIKKKTPSPRLTIRSDLGDTDEGDITNTGKKKQPLRSKFGQNLENRNEGELEKSTTKEPPKQPGFGPGQGNTDQSTENIASQEGEESVLRSTAQQLAKQLADDAKAYQRLQHNVKHPAKESKAKASDLNYKLLVSGEDQFRCLKVIMRVFAAILAGGILYMMLYFSFGFTLETAGYMMIGMTLFFIIGFVFSKLIRCIILIMVPSLFTKQGRALFLSLITGILIAGPVVNIASNTEELSTSMGCTADLIYNQTQQLRRQLVEPLYELARKLQRYLNESKSITDTLEEALKPLKTVLSAFATATQAVLNTLAQISAVSTEIANVKFSQNVF